MEYACEDIYRLSGQFDKVVCVSFKHGSPAFKKYGSYLIGQFKYTPKERKTLQAIIENEKYDRNDGMVRFIPSTVSKMTTEQTLALRKEGILASEIISIEQSIEKEDNEFVKTQVRTLPDPIEIPFDSTGVNEEDVFLYLISSRIKSGYALTPSEIFRYNGIMLRENDGKITEKERENLTDPNTGEVYKGVRFHYLKSKFLKDKLSKKEEAELSSITGEVVKKRLRCLEKEIKKGATKLSEVGKQYPTAVRVLSRLALTYEPERFTHGEFAVWLDYERFIHIFAKHVTETTVGDRYEQMGSKFQYAIKDIRRLIETVLDQEYKSILAHFKTKPDKAYRRHGAMSVYYNGDYYTFEILPNGKLMTFFKYHPPQ